MSSAAGSAGAVVSTRLQFNTLAIYVLLDRMAEAFSSTSFSTAPMALPLYQSTG